MRSPGVTVGRAVRERRRLLAIRSSEMGDRAMEKPEVPFPKHWLYYIAIKFVVLAGAVALVLRLYEVW